MSLTVRGYSGESDLRRLVALEHAILAACWPRAPYWHSGDLIWNLITSQPDRDLSGPVEEIQLWLVDDEVAGFAALLSADELHVDIRPDVADQRELLDAACAWGEEQARGGPGTLTITALDSDPHRREVLEARGYRHVGPGGVRMRRSLLGAIAEPDLPAGTRLRDGGEVDLTERVAAHRDAWTHLDHIGIANARSAFSTRLYERLRAAPEYDRALDLAVETTTGVIASCCICWVDASNRVGTFEPVGTREAFRGRRLARALVIEGLRRLQATGMHTALIGTASFNRPAQSVYRACGFELSDLEQRYVKTVAPPAPPPIGGTR